MSVKRLTLTVPFPSVERVERVLGLSSDSKRKISKEIETLWPTLLSIETNPLALFTVFRIQKAEAQGESVLSTDFEIVRGLWLEPRLPFPFNPEYAKAYHSLLIGLITLGSGLEDAASRAFAEGESLKGWLADSLGTLMLRDAFSVFLERMSGEIEGELGPRYAPGCPPLSLGAQKRIFELLGAAQAGMRLTKGSMIHPVKSTTFVLGIGERRTAREPVPCRNCEHAALCYGGVFEENPKGVGGVMR